MSMAKLYCSSFGKRDVNSWEKKAKKSVNHEKKLHNRKDNLVLNIKKANKTPTQKTESDDTILNTLLEFNFDITKTLKELNYVPKGSNYKRVNNIINNYKGS